MKIEFVREPACLGFGVKILTIDEIKKNKDGSGVNLIYNKKNIFIPYSNIIAIEE